MPFLKKFPIQSLRVSKQMSKLLAEWLNSKVEFDKKITYDTMDKQFHTGYLFGFVLFNMGFEANLVSHYVKSDNTDAVIKNYISLERALRDQLKIKLTIQHCLDLINMKPGSCARLLYEIKMATDKIKKTKPKVTLTSTRFESYPSSPVDGATSNIESILVVPEISAYESQTAAHFEHMLKSKLKRNNEFVPKFKLNAVKVELPPIPKNVPIKKEVPQKQRKVSKQASFNWEPETLPQQFTTKSKIPNVFRFNLDSYR
jgi:hypothetical protein